MAASDSFLWSNQNRYGSMTVVRSLLPHELSDFFAHCAYCFRDKSPPPPASYFERHWFSDPNRDLKGILVAVVRKCQPNQKEDSSSDDDIVENVPTSTVLPLHKSPHRELIVSSVRIYKRKIFVGEKQINIAGIGEVCTRDEFRCRGLAKRLLRAAIDLSSSMNLCLSALHASPKFTKFYSSLGWVSVISEKVLVEFVVNNPEEYSHDEKRAKVRNSRIEENLHTRCANIAFLTERTDEAEEKQNSFVPSKRKKHGPLSSSDEELEVTRIAKERLLFAESLRQKAKEKAARIKLERFKVLEESGDDSKKLSQLYKSINTVLDTKTVSCGIMVRSESYIREWISCDPRVYGAINLSTATNLSTDNTFHVEGDIIPKRTSRFTVTLKKMPHLQIAYSLNNVTKEEEFEGALVLASKKGYIHIIDFAPSEKQLRLDGGKNVLQVLIEKTMATNPVLFNNIVENKNENKIVIKTHKVHNDSDTTKEKRVSIVMPLSVAARANLMDCVKNRLDDHGWMYRSISTVANDGVHESSEEAVEGNKIIEEMKRLSVYDVSGGGHIVWPIDSF